VYVAVVLTEDVGDPEADSPDPALAGYQAGATLMARETGERHPTTGERVFELLTDPGEAADPDYRRNSA
jgi:hypothetical protein